MCGYESIINTSDTVIFDLVQNTLIETIFEDKYSGYFSNNSTNCPIIDYTLIDYHTEVELNSTT